MRPRDSNAHATSRRLNLLRRLLTWSLPNQRLSQPTPRLNPPETAIAVIIPRRIYVTIMLNVAETLAVGLTANRRVVQHDK